MNMTDNAIYSWLLEQPTFQAEFESLLLSSVKSQFSIFATTEFKHDCDYLLKCASVLAQSHESRMHDIALRISQYCLQNKDTTSSHQKDSAQFILNVLANRTAINLAKEKGFLETHDTKWQDSFIGNLNWVKEEIKHSVCLKSGERINVNVFQRSFWEALSKYKTLSISAPTSAGKSYLIKQWVLEEIAGEKNQQIVYVVPTRALISEVESDFQRALSEEIQASKVNVTSFPFVQFSDRSKPCVYILTQERLQLLLLRNPPIIDVLIVDEAYKLADGDRGILLQHVIEKTMAASPDVKVIYISPQASNPEVLVDSTSSSFSGKFSDITVNQNLIWASQKRGVKWSLDLFSGGKKISMGEISLPNNPSPASLKLPMLAHALGKSGGNILYVNRASDAESTAEQLCDLIGFDNQINDQRLLDLIELCQKVIHRSYKLAEVLKYGVAFHYGNIPLIIREEVETLFRDGVIKFLICTSTLVEGVNLPCKNIYIRSPKRGNGNPMTPADFWNLAGRAGRWGKDFQGNIICIDPEIWDAPESKVLMPIKRATDEAFLREDELIEYIESGTPRAAAASKAKSLLESMTSYLAINQKTHGSIKNIPGVEKFTSQSIERLDNAVRTYLTVDSIPESIIANHPGISPLAMKEMLDYFEVYPGEKDALLVPYASDTDATDKYVEIFKSLFGRLTNEFTNTPSFLFRQAIATVHWMQGRPIRFIIEERKKALPAESIHKTIREVLQDIESVARYKSPKYISCYNDILKFYFEKSGREDLASEIEDITLYLELGVNTTTQLSLLNLGISRTSAVEVKEFITADSFSERDCLVWFSNPNNNWRSRELPVIVKREIEKMLEMHTS